MIFIQTPQEFSFKEVTRFLSRNEKECLHTIHHNEIFKVLEINNQLTLFSIVFDKDLIIAIHTPDKSITIQDNIKQYIIDWFDLTTDLKHFYKDVQKDEVLQNLCQQYYGLRMIGMPDLFESLVWSVIGQQINLNFAYSLKERLVRNYGRSIIHNNETFYALPTPEKLASLNIEDFLPHQFSRSKAQYILNISRAFAEGNLIQDEIKKLPFDEIRQKLIAIKGVGNWTANYSMMKSLKSYDAFPIEDVGLHNAIKNQYKLNGKPSLAELHKMSENWSGWRGYATFYFWHSLLT